MDSFTTGPFYDARSGIYHLMFQYKTPRTWGHAISKDLLHWENLPIAINNDESYDSGGVFTGSTTVLTDGTPVAMYSVSTNNKMCIAYPSNENDVNLTQWTDYANNCILNANTSVPDGRDPTTSWTTDSGKTWTFGVCIDLYTYNAVSKFMLIYISIFSICDTRTRFKWCSCYIYN